MGEDLSNFYANNRRWKHIGEVPTSMEGDTGAAYQSGHLRAVVSLDGPEEYWHISVSKDTGLYPTWDEIADARYDLCPHYIDMALILPPPEDYTNTHPTVLQVTEVRDPEMPIDRGTQQPRTKATLLGKVGDEHLMY